MSKVLLVLLGESGSGKTSIAEELSRRYGLSILPSYTTRPKRQATDKDHTYISLGEFMLLKNKVASNFYSGNYYCATEDQIEMFDVYVCDCEGIKDLKTNYTGEKKILVIGIDVDAKERMNRMMNRGDGVGSVAIRMKQDMGEFQYKDMLSDYRVKNNKLQDAVDSIYQLYQEELQNEM